MNRTSNNRKASATGTLRGGSGDLYCVDLSKHHFHVNRYTAHGELRASKALTRTKFEQLVVDPQRATGVWAMEACAGSHHWGQVLMGRGDTVRLLPAQFVAGRRVGNKNDGNDAAAIFATHVDPRVRPVPVKTEAQQDAATLHGVRQQLVAQRTALLNALRGQLAERGLITGKGQQSLNALLILVQDGSLLPERERLRLVLATARPVLDVLNTQIAELDRMVARHAAGSGLASALMAIPGVGPITASAIVTEHAQGVQRFQDCRQFAASFGLHPGEHSTGGKTQLTGITRRGNAYLRTLLVQGAHTLLSSACPKPRKEGDNRAPRAQGTHDLHDFARRMKDRGKRHGVIVCAIANRMARLVFAMLRHGVVYEPRRPQRTAARTQHPAALTTCPPVPTAQGGH